MTPQFLPCWTFRFHWITALTLWAKVIFFWFIYSLRYCNKLWWYFKAEEDSTLLDTAILWHNSSSLHSLDLLNKLMDQSYDETLPSANEDVPASTPGPFLERQPGVQSRRASSRVKTVLPSLAWAQPSNAPKVAKRVRRARNTHTGNRGGHHHHHHHPHHGHLMRVGCVLGTCQVQNLSHRLYQLVGQSGREDSSPINPRSPHSFG